ncbi:hypothetical protein C7S13_2729 [Burkholderia cepacia]|nr:hypothetical protein [Burkholderia cepacia]
MPTTSRAGRFVWRDGRKELKISELLGASLTAAIVAGLLIGIVSVKDFGEVSIFFPLWLSRSHFPWQCCFRIRSIGPARCFLGGRYCRCWSSWAVRLD